MNIGLRNEICLVRNQGPCMEGQILWGIVVVKDSRRSGFHNIVYYSKREAWKEI
jgi:hypothetical protein